MTPPQPPATDSPSAAGGWLSRPRRAIDALLAVAWAARCVVCDMPLDAPTRGVVCPVCVQCIARLAPPVCDRCGLPITPAAIDPGPAGLPRCAACRRHGGPPTPRRAAGLHEGPLRAMIHAFKYGGRRSLAEPLAAMLRDAAGDWLHEADAVVPVPLHPVRRWRRGFNQADDLAAGLGLPVLHPIRRARHTRPQAELSRGVRLRAVRHAFTPAVRAADRAPAVIRARTLLVVDDVITTGATVEACAALLREAGAADVRALSVALAPLSPARRRRI